VIDFHGVTGYIDISPGYPQYGGYGLGDRDAGIFFKVVNYQVCTDGATGRMYPCLRTIGTWESESGYRPCSKLMYADCVDPVFSTADNSVPLDWPLPIYKYMGPGVVGFMLFMGIVAALVSLFFLVIVFWYAKTPVIKASHSTMLYFILFGCLLGCAYIMVNAARVTVGLCYAGLWLGHLSYGVVFGTLFLKTWRVYRLVNSSLRRIKISTTYINAVVLGTIGVLCVYLLIMSVVDKAAVAYQNNYSGNQETKTAYCSFRISAMSIVLFTVEGLVLVAGCVMCYLSKGVPDIVNESAYIAFCKPTTTHALHPS